MRQSLLVFVTAISLVFSEIGRADELEDTITKSLTPEHFDPGSVGQHTMVYLSKDGDRIFVDGTELLRLNQAGLERGIRYKLLDFKILQRSLSGSIATVIYKAKTSEEFQGESATTISTSSEIWERHVHGWVLLFAATQEVKAKP